MIIIGIDPGKTIGLVLYNTDARRAVKSTCVSDAQTALRWVFAECRHGDGMAPIAIERPRIYQSAGNELCDTIEQTGWLMAMLGGGYMPVARAAGVYLCPPIMADDCEVYLLERRAVVGALSATMGSTVRGDAGVWQALCALHPDAMRRPVNGRPATRHRPAVEAVEAGPLYGVNSHARAALAVAWALGKHLEAP